MGSNLMAWAVVLACIASSAFTAYIVNNSWEAKYAKLELTVERDKSEAITDIADRQAEKYAEMVMQYNKALDTVAGIVASRDVEQETLATKYRNLYASYTRLQKQAPSSALCNVDSVRTPMLMRAAVEANQIRTRIATSAGSPIP